MQTTVCTSAGLRPAMRYHGAKFRLAPWILRFFPPHGCYVEPFGGAAGVLIQKPRVYAEVYNDLDGEVVNFFRVLRDPRMRADLVEACRLTPYAREEFDLSYQPTDDAVERARRCCVRAAMGYGSAGATKASTGFRTDTRRKYGTAQHNWADYPGSLGAIGERFAGVLIENRDAIAVMEDHDGPDTLHFVDPPYVYSTRHMRNRGGYRHELDDDGHRRLLETLKGLSGMVVLSGYRSGLYDAALADWQRFETEARISGRRGASLRTECVWLNRACSAALVRSRDDLFAGGA
ncbi:DNA methyltransferase [Rubrivivax gelatinosus]|uniref:DNA adenine methylase n=1 Tax=Rubrivivax gelatinosus TaxID=28068 RepID=UPI0019078CD7|nr:DNA adenine methylase [Rubrivivax gelatinosus]MBK1614983.1 DNA methyltransferase [Rubrivivax gelatinosus]MBZ8143153.1 DNA methyltransferase [Rubrivivax gelatinosus]